MTTRRNDNAPRPTMTLATPWRRAAGSGCAGAAPGGGREGCSPRAGRCGARSENRLPAETRTRGDGVSPAPRDSADSRNPRPGDANPAITSPDPEDPT